MASFHCFFDSSGNWVNLSYRGAQDSTSQPYGQVAHTWKYWDSGFVDNNCHTTWQAQCVQWDWAVVVLASTPVDVYGSTAGYMGYAWDPDDAHVKGWTKHHYGYPGCNQGGSPASGCVANTLWGQSAACTSGTYDYPVGGWNRRMSHGCDMSGGHSGGALYTDDAAIVGINSAELTGCWASCTSSNPNFALRLTDWHGYWMNYYRTIY